MNDAKITITDEYRGVNTESLPESSLGTSWAQITYRLGTEQETTQLYDLDNFNQGLLYSIQRTENFLTTRKKEKFDQGMRELLEKTLEEMRERNRREELNLDERMGRRYTI